MDSKERKMCERLEPGRLGRDLPSHLPQGQLIQSQTHGEKQRCGKSSVRLNTACDETINRGSSIILSSVSNNHNILHISTQVQGAVAPICSERVEAKRMCCSAAAPSLISSKRLEERASHSARLRTQHDEVNSEQEIRISSWQTCP